MFSFGNIECSLYPETLKKDESIGNIVFESDKLLVAYNLASEAHKGQLRKFEVLMMFYDEWGITEEKYLTTAMVRIFLRSEN